MSKAPGNDWLNGEEFGAAVSLSAMAFVRSMAADDAVHALERESSYDSGFEAGVLASENGLGRSDV